MKLAKRKLRSDQDTTTAVALLKGTDVSLVDMNDPSLITVRRTITDDIASLSTVSQVDYGGVILKPNQFSNQVDNLCLADNDSGGSSMDSDGEKLSSSISEWRTNLQKGWQNSTDNFITIRCRDDTAVPLLASNQDIYLRGNTRSHLLVAAQAVPYHQEKTYRQALENVPIQVRAYYDADDTTTKVSLGEVDQLSQQSISTDLPETLQSQAMPEKLMQTRVRNLLAQPAVGITEAKPAPAPAPAPTPASQADTPAAAL